MSLTIQAARHTFNWPKHYAVPDQALLRVINAKVYQDGQLVPNATIVVDQGQVDYEHPSKGQYVLLTAELAGEHAQLQIEVDFTDPASADYHPTKEEERAQAKRTHQKKHQRKHKPHSHHRWSRILIGILLLIVILLGINACHQHQVNQQQQDRINKLQNQNNKQANQISALKSAVSQYQKDKNQDELNQRLDKISDQLSSSSPLRDTINKIKNDPSNAQQYVTKVSGNSSFVQNIENQISAWLAQYGIQLN